MWSVTQGEALSDLSHTYPFISLALQSGQGRLKHVAPHSELWSWPWLWLALEHSLAWAGKHRTQSPKPLAVRVSNTKKHGSEMQVKLADLLPPLKCTRCKSTVLWSDCFCFLLLLRIRLPLSSFLAFTFFYTHTHTNTYFYTMLWSLLSLTHTCLLCTPSYIQLWTLSEPHSCLKLRLANEEMSSQLSGLDASRKTCRISPTASSVLFLLNVCVCLCVYGSVCICVSTVWTHIHKMLPVSVQSNVGEYEKCVFVHGRPKESSTPLLTYFTAWDWGWHLPCPGILKEHI